MIQTIVPVWNDESIYADTPFPFPFVLVVVQGQGEVILNFVRKKGLSVFTTLALFSTLHRGFAQF